MKLASLIESYKPEKRGIPEPPYIIAEAGVNHEGSMDLAKRLIEEAAEGGAQAIKFQTYKAETIASVNSPSYWDRSKEPTSSQFELFKKYDKFWKSEYEKLKVICNEVGIEFLSTPFDAESAEFLNDLMPVFKISSSDLTNWPFIEQIASYGKPIILSTGASNMDEISEVVEMIENLGNPLCLMHCILCYPTPNHLANLAMIKDLQKHFAQHLIGYSDHTLPGNMDVITYANVMGANIIEKHFTHDKTLPGNDHYHAMDKEDLKLFFEKSRAIFELLGSDEKYCLEQEKQARLNARRSLVVNKDLPKGAELSINDLTWKRPGTGISPKEIKHVIAKKTTRFLSADSVLQRDDIE